MLHRSTWTWSPLRLKWPGVIETKSGNTKLFGAVSWSTTQGALIGTRAFTAASKSRGLNRHTTKRMANPHLNKPVRHRYFLGLCVLTGLGGAIAGYMVPIDPSTLPAPADPFDVKLIEDELRSIFDFRPEMAPNVLHLLFLFTMRRVWQCSTGQTSDIPGAIEAKPSVLPPPVYGGIQGDSGDTHAVIQSLTLRHTISYADALVLAAVVALRFLSQGKVDVAWKCGRVDNEELFVLDPTLQGSIPHPLRPPQCLVSPVGTDNQKDDVLGAWIGVYHSMGFTMDEFIALLGLHTVGFIRENAPAHTLQWTRDPFHLNNSYYRMLLEHTYKPVGYGSKPGVVHVACGTAAMKSNLACLPFEAELATDRRTRSIVQRFAQDEKQWWQNVSRAFTRLCEYGYATEEYWKQMDAREREEAAQEEAAASNRNKLWTQVRNKFLSASWSTQRSTHSRLHGYRAPQSRR